MKHPITLKQALPLALFAAFTHTALAEEAPTSDADSTLDTVLITATRTEETVTKTLAPATVYTKDDIEQLQAHSVTELLQRIPGASINSNGGAGSVASVFLRGTNSSHTLFLIDGQRINSATLGTSPLESLDVNQIERIEIVRGPRSSLYGADAIGGVIQIFTKQGGEAGLHPKISYGFGNHGTQQTTVSVNGAQDGFRGSFSGSYYDTDGIDALIDDNGTNFDNDAYRNTSTSASVGYRFDNDADISLSHYKSNSENEYDNGFLPNTRPYSRSGLETTSFKWEQPVISDLWKSTVQLGETRNTYEDFDDLDRRTFSKFNTRRESASWQNDFTFKTGAVSHVLTGGVDYYNDEVNSTSPFTDATGKPVKERDNLGTFVQEQMEVGKHQLVLGLRNDDNEQYNNNATGNASYGYALRDDLRIIASYGTAFKAPTFNDLFWPITPWSAGNPNLKPEKSTNYEIGLKGTPAFGSWELNVFENNITDLIEWAEVPPGSWFYTPSNVDKAEIQGVEFALNTSIQEWNIVFNTSYIDARYDGKGADHDNFLINRPRHTLNLDISRNFGAYEFGTEFVAQSKRYTDRSNQNVEGGNNLVNVRAAYNLTKEVKLQLKLTNLFDNQYRINDRYNTEGFGYMASIVYTPEL
ncbi:MAG: TonB-dependent receptor [Pseudomonadales bacterium]